MSFTIVSLRFQPIHIQAVTPTTYFASTRTRRQTPRRRSVKAAAAVGKPVTVLSSRAGHVTPSQLRGLYKTFAYVPTAADRNTIGETVRVAQGLGGVKCREVSRRPPRGASGRMRVRGGRGRVGVEGLEPRASAARLGEEVRSVGREQSETVAHASARRETWYGWPL
ncbi:hypothetical protein EDB84DRAFT_1560054 [Lactarius hengduanensis]|nr:hypothetical protein EDB84DRAFT_1560054 [Lactarius hengduanensis]